MVLDGILIGSLAFAGYLNYIELQKIKQKLELIELWFLNNDLRINSIQEHIYEKDTFEDC